MSDKLDIPGLRYALERLALGFESADPHIRLEAKAVARQNFGQISSELQRLVTRRYRVKRLKKRPRSTRV